MRVKEKIKENETPYNNFVWIVNRAVKVLKESMNEAEQDSTPISELIHNTFQKENTGFDSLLYWTKTEDILINELIEQITKHDWCPGDDEEIREYLERRRDMVLPILEEGTMEYKLLYNIYTEILEENDLQMIIYLVMTFAKVFYWKTLDYHTLETMQN